MATKKPSAAELEKQCIEAENAFKALKEQWLQTRKEEEEAERAKLEAERELRYNAVIDAYNKFEELRSKFVDDYGSFTFKAKCEDGDLCDWVFRSLGLM